MKKQLKRLASVLLCALVLVSAFLPADVVRASSASTDDEAWLAELREYFKYDEGEWYGMLAGSLASSLNDDSWLRGMLLGGVLSQDIEYYDQPAKIFDKVNNAYKDDLTSTASPNCNYYYTGDTDNSSTSNYHVFQDNSDYSTHNYNYQWYNPITQNYNYTENFQYSYEYNTYYYQQTTNNYQYDYYYIDNSTHVTYYIVETDTETGEENDYLYDVYYELPDGRNSYNLTKEDVWGTYFIYNVDRYESVAEDDGTTLGLWHFDGDTKDSSYWNNSAGVAGNLQYSDGVFEMGKYMPESTSTVTELYLDKCVFDADGSYTLEWIEYIPQYSDSDYVSVGTSTDYHYSYIGAFLFPGYRYCNVGIQYETFNYFALTFDGSDYNLFVNGIKQSISNYSDFSPSYTYYPVDTVCGFSISDNSISWYPSSTKYREMYSEYSSINDRYYYGYSRQHYNTVIDEMRLSKGVLYTSDYVPSAEPFTTNSVLVIPDGTEDNSILLYSNYDITDYRIGGARPTYPTNGSVYIYLEDDIVSSVQQYQVNQWVEVDARVYSDGSTTDLKGYDMSEFKVSEPEENPDDSGDGSGSGDDSGDGSDSGSGDDSGGEGLEVLLDGIRDVFDTLGSIVGTVLSSISGFLASALESLSLFSDFSSGFSGFLSQTFTFIPSEVWSLVGAGITLMIIAGIIKLIRG